MDNSIKAVLYINKPGTMTKVQRLRVIKWLVNQANALQEEGAEYTKGIYRARLLSTKGAKK